VNRSRLVRASDVTVVIPTIPGREDLLARAVRSVDSQRPHRPGDIIIEVDTARTGAAATRNRAVDRVTTDWIAWLDDDDELLPNHLRVLCGGASRTGADMIYSYAEFIGGRDPLGCWHRGTLVPEPINVPFDDEARAAIRRDGNHIPITYLVRTELVRQVGGFPEGGSDPTVTVKHSGDCEDYLLILRMLDAGARFHHVTGVRTWRYHIHDANTGGRGAHRMHELDTPPPGHQTATATN
jgi:glycosyltransferase involved in cell wall biosynthesis